MLGWATGTCTGTCDPAQGPSSGPCGEHRPAEGTWATKKPAGGAGRSSALVRSCEFKSLLFSSFSIFYLDFALPTTGLHRAAQGPCTGAGCSDPVDPVTLRRLERLLGRRHLGREFRALRSKKRRPRGLKLGKKMLCNP